LASIEINGKEAFGNILRVVSVRDLKAHYPARKNGEATSATAFVPSSVKFGAIKKRGGKR
jgi:hypothetical protein